MNALVLYLVSKFNSLTINSTNLDCAAYAAYQITAKNDDNQIVTIDISYDDELFNFTISYADGHLEIKECLDILDLIQAVKSFVETDDFIKAI